VTTTDILWRSVRHRSQTQVDRARFGARSHLAVGPIRRAGATVRTKSRREDVCPDFAHRVYPGSCRGCGPMARYRQHCHQATSERQTTVAPLSLIAVQSRNLMVAHPGSGPGPSISIGGRRRDNPAVMFDRLRSSRALYIQLLTSSERALGPFSANNGSVLLRLVRLADPQMDEVQTALGPPSQRRYDRLARRPASISSIACMVAAARFMSASTGSASDTRRAIGRRCRVPVAVGCPPAAGPQHEGP
jgi:hypothetical protein